MDLFMDEKAPKDLISILRESIDVVKMILYHEIKTFLVSSEPKLPSRETRLLAGAVINELFGTPNTEEPFASFAEDHETQIQATLASLQTNLARLRPLITDTLRIQCLCDKQEGIDSLDVLKRAREAGLLLMEREMPMPGPFVGLVNRLGQRYVFLRDLEVKDS